MADADPMEKIRDDTHVTPDPAGLLGSGCAGTALRVMKIAYKFCVPMSSTSTTDSGRSDRGDYPNFFRTIAPDTFYDGAWIADGAMNAHRVLL